MSAEKGENDNKKIPLKCHKLKNQRSHPAEYHNRSFILSPVISIDNFFYSLIENIYKFSFWASGLMPQTSH